MAGTGRNVQIKFYSRAERERLHPPGSTMAFGGSCHMSPEAADSLAYNLVRLDRASGMYQRVQMTPVDERMVIEEARARERANAAMANRDRPALWASGRR